MLPGQYACLRPTLWETLLGAAYYSPLPISVANWHAEKLSKHIPPCCEQLIDHECNAEGRHCTLLQSCTNLCHTWSTMGATCVLGLLCLSCHV
eukprot:1160781-Pelagomonas_calceolata.AAC.20